ncbi:MAG: TatD family hydrolase [Bdellovibrionales bacterium]
MNTWIDVHTHLNMLDLPAEAALQEAAAAGVSHVITIGTGPEDWPLVLGYAQKYFPQVACTLGVHPHDAQLWNAQVAEQLRAGLKNREVVAVGEIGLDYYYNNSPREVQMAAFREQMQIAEAAGLPVEIHTRDAEDDTILVLNEFKGRVKGLLHCFTSSWRMAEAALAVDFNISFSGVVTFKNAEELRLTCGKVPLDRLHVETDAPFLAPAPHRGRKNRPSMVVHTAELVAKLKGLSPVELARATNANAAKMFPRWGLPV